MDVVCLLGDEPFSLRYRAQFGGRVWGVRNVTIHLKSGYDHAAW
jgi:hypothetical protein